MTSYLRRNYVSCLRAAAAALFVLLFCTLNVSAQINAKKDFSIEAGDAAMTLKEFAQQSGAELLYSADVVEGVKTHAVKGEFTPKDALEIMVADTVLVVSQGRTTGGLAVRRATDAEAKNVNRAIAQNSERPSHQKNDTEGEMKDGTLKLPDYMVTGAKTLNADIRRTADDPQPYVVFDSAQIESSGASDLEEFFRKRLTMNTQRTANGQVTTGSGSTAPLGPANGNLSQINLRGLGAEETLILVDGRRAPRFQSANQGNAFTQADINGIPISAIQRIEILPSTAGGIYGGGANGGVINIIRKRNYNAITVQLSQSGAFRGGGEKSVAMVSGGAALRRTQVNFSASYADSHPLYASDNGLWELARRRWIAVEPQYAAAGGVTNPFMGSTTNVRSSDGSALILKSTGQSLGSDRTFVPLGYAGVTTDGGAALVGNSGRYNFDLSNDSGGKFARLMGSAVVKSANIELRHSFGQKIDLFLTADVSQNRSRSVGLAGISTNLPATATNNPFVQAVNIAVPGQPAAPIESDLRSAALSAGIIARLSHDWTLTAETNLGFAHNKLSQFSLYLSTLTTAYRTDPNLNPFRDINRYPIDYAAYMSSTQGPFVTEPKTEQSEGTVRIAGPLWNLPAGPLSITALVNYRAEKSLQFIQSLPNPIIPPTVIPKRSQDTDSAYVELDIPLVAAKNPRFLLQSLDFQASARYDRYTSVLASPTSYPSTVPPASISHVTNRFSSTEGTIAMRWSPLRDLAVRASHATGFLPPAINQVVPSFTTTTFLDSGFLDPRRGNTPVPVPYGRISAGNPQLQPESSTSDSFGVIWSPAFLSKFRLSLDYSRIRKSGEISFPTQTVAFLEQYFPDRVTRDPLTDADRALGYTGGHIQSLNFSLINTARTQLQAWDLQGEFDHETEHLGMFHVYLGGTYQAQYRVTTLPTSVPYNTAGHADGPLKFRLNGGIDWTFKHWNAGWNVQFYDGYSVTFASLPASDNLSTIALQGASRIPSQAYHDLNVRYRFFGGGSSILKNSDISISIQNIFDKYPPVLSSGLGGPLGTFSAYGDPRLRRFSISARKSF